MSRRASAIAFGTQCGLERLARGTEIGILKRIEARPIRPFAWGWVGLADFWLPPGSGIRFRKGRFSMATKTTEQPGADAAPADAPRPPADPRLKVLKKFNGKFLPKGVLRDRHRAIMTRWNSGDDHGGVTVDELKTLLDDWKGTREKPPRKPKA
jgi:hypothetical protein